MTGTTVSVIVATRNRQVLLAGTIEALLAQDWPRDRLEIVVADNGSTDSTEAVVRAATSRAGIAAVRYLKIDQPGKSFAVNAAIGEASGSLLAFTDDDVRPDPSWIQQIVGAFEDPAVDFIAGRILPIWEAPPPSWLSPALYGVLAVPDNGLTRIAIDGDANQHVMPIGANMAVRADVIRRVGGLRTDLGKLDGTLRTGEDHELFLRLLHNGCRGVYEPAAVVRHWVPRDRLHRRYFRAWLYQNGRDVAKLQQAYPSPAIRFLAVPRYLWREAVLNALGAFSAGDKVRRFAAALRVIWIMGYVRETWRTVRA